MVAFALMKGMHLTCCFDRACRPNALRAGILLCSVRGLTSTESKICFVLDGAPTWLLGFQSAQAGVWPT